MPRANSLGCSGLVVAVVALTFAGFIASPAAAASTDLCGPVATKVACENTRAGTPGWQVDGVGDPAMQGFATAMSVDIGETVHFKIRTDAWSYHLDIYRMGYYGGVGAREVASGITPTAHLPQVQPQCLRDGSSGLVDCGNWAESASWAVPTTAVSGVYFAELTRADTGLRSQIFFVVRDDASRSAIVYQTSDETWQAYNDYGGNTLYTGSPAGRAFKVSYNRPFDNAGKAPNGISPADSWVMWSDYPMIRWIERNGYDVSYISSFDVERDANAVSLRTHRVFVDAGHDEYWSANQRANITAARDDGVNLAFFSGNLMFWKTRWEPSVDGTATAGRTVVCYKDTHANAPIDPAGPSMWTGTWRDPRFSPPGDGGRPENALTGQLFEYNDSHVDYPIQVPATFSKLRFWRNTTIAGLAPGQVAALAPHTLGNEWDVDVDNGFRPPGTFDLSSTTVAATTALVDYGTDYGDETLTHSLTLSRSPSGALVFDAGTMQWAWGLDPGSRATTTDRNMQQATVNMLADMDAQPATLQPELVRAAPSVDRTPPTSTITTPRAGAALRNGTAVEITGTATDTGGVVAGVEVSTDGGASWHPANGTTHWRYRWVVNRASRTTIRSRAVDDSGNLETPTDGVTMSAQCPCSLFGATVPAAADGGDAKQAELGVKFDVDAPGYVTGVRFYKSEANTGPHTASVWTADGTRLTTASFGNESASGWQSVTFTRPVPVVPHHTYVASYHTERGHYAATPYSFYGVPVASGPTRFDSGPLHAPLSQEVGGNGVQQPGASAFPRQSTNGSNYWVDVAFVPASSTEQERFTRAETTSAPAPPDASLFGASRPTIADACAASSGSELGMKFTADTSGVITGVRFYKSPENTGVHTGTLWSAQGTELATATFGAETGRGWQTATFPAPIAVRAGTVYVVSYHTTNGAYAQTRGFFDTTDAKPPLRGIASGDAGGNGVAIDGPHAFPTRSYLATNYWVDVLFSGSAAPAHHRAAAPPPVAAATSAAGPAPGRRSRSAPALTRATPSDPTASPVPFRRVPRRPSPRVATAIDATRRRWVKWPLHPHAEATAAPAARSSPRRRRSASSRHCANRAAFGYRRGA